MCNLLDSISFKFDFIGCTETWFTSETDYKSFQIPVHFGEIIITLHCLKS